MVDCGIDALVEEFHSPLLSFVRGRLQSSNDAEDIVQETWMRSMSAIASGTVLNVRAYLHRVARNLIIDHGQRRSRGIETTVDESILLSIPDPKVHIERQFLIEEELRRIDAVIASMPPRSRTVFLLARMEQLSYAEIGRRLGISRQTVYEHMMRAMLAMQEAIPNKQAQQTDS